MTYPWKSQDQIYCLPLLETVIRPLPRFKEKDHRLQLLMGGVIFLKPSHTLLVSAFYNPFLTVQLDKIVNMVVRLV